MVQNPSPYAPPESTLAPEGLQVQAAPDATLGRRFWNYVIDAIAVQLGSTAVTVVVVAVWPDLLSNFFVSFAFGTALYAAYFGLFEAAFGRTPAKWITGTRVVARDGSTPTLDAIALRTLVRLIPFEPFSFLFANSGWHDRMSETRVVYTRP